MSLWLHSLMPTYLIKQSDEQTFCSASPQTQIESGDPSSTQCQLPSDYRWMAQALPILKAASHPKSLFCISTVGPPQWWRICLQCRRHGFNPWVGKTPWRRKWQPIPVFLPGESHGRKSLAGYSSWSCKESETMEATKQQQQTLQQQAPGVFNGWNSRISLLSKGPLFLGFAICETSGNTHGQDHFFQQHHTSFQNSSLGSQQVSYNPSGNTFFTENNHPANEEGKDTLQCPRKALSEAIV